MIVRSILLFSAVFALTCSVSFAQVTIQNPDTDILPDGSAFLFLEAESAIELGGGPPEAATVGFILVDKENPIQTITQDANGVEVVNGGLDVLTADTNASGGAAIFHQLGGGGNAKWQVQFAIPATYYLYPHYSFYNRDNNTNFGNEDSIYVPPSFNANSRDSWVGFEGQGQFGCQPGGDDPKTGDSDRDGWMPLGKNIVSAGEVETHNSTDEAFWEGQFHWSRMDIAVDMDENDAYIGDNGHCIQYVVSEDQVGTVLDFEISGREQYGVIDGFLFSTNNELLDIYTQDEVDAFFLNLGGDVLLGDFDESGVLDLPDVNLLSTEIATGAGDLKFDLTGDGVVDTADLDNWVKEQRVTWFGDSNLDGEFNSTDFVGVFTAGKYETGEAAGWDEGDWTGDLRFESGDMVSAFTDGGYELGPPPAAVNAVPEPATGILLFFGIVGLGIFRRQR